MRPGRSSGRNSEPSLSRSHSPMITGLASCARGAPLSGLPPSRQCVSQCSLPSCHSTAGPFGYRGSIACRFLTEVYFFSWWLVRVHSSPNLQSALGLAWMRGPAPARGSQQARSVAAVRGICARNLCSTDQHGTEPATATAVHSASAFFDHYSVCGGFHYPRASPRPSHGLCMGGRYVPDPPLSPTSTTTPSRVHSVSPCQSSSLHSPHPRPPPPPQAGIVRCGTHPWSWGKTEIPTGWVVLQP